MTINYLVLNIQKKLWGTQSKWKKTQGLKVLSKKFDTLFKKVKKDTLIWIDTEGYEEKILSGAKNILKLQCPLVIEFWPKALLKFNSYNSLKAHIRYYNYLYDLSKPKPIKLKINKKI